MCILCAFFTWYKANTKKGPARERNEWKYTWSFTSGEKSAQLTTGRKKERKKEEEREKKISLSLSALHERAICFRQPLICKMQFGFNSQVSFTLFLFFPKISERRQSLLPS